MFVGLALLMLFVRHVLSVPEDWSECPQVCHCKWISGKKSALCREAGFTVVPNTLNSDMQVLDITGNAIQHLPKDAFRSVGLIHLQRVFLKSAGVHDVHKDAFRELKILVEIDLSDNFIGSLHPETFTGNDRLRAICMNGNPLSELKNAQFPSLPHLKSLEFQHCQIRYVHRDAFLHLPALESLSLNGNKLNHLSATAFLPVPKLKTLVLDGNPWRCDCELRAFRNWLLHSKLYSHSLACTYPAESKGKRWEEVEAAKFACAPNVTADDAVIQGVPGGNVTLKCLVFGDPEPTVSWLFNGYTVLDNDTTSAAAAAATADVDSQLYVEERYAEERRGEKWSLVTLQNVSDTSAGEYTCRGANVRGEASANISLILPKEAVATTMKKDETLLKTYALIVASASCAALALLVLALYQAHRCMAVKRRRRRRNKLKGGDGSSSGGGSSGGAIGFSDQDKKLLDVSITTTTDRQTAGSCDGFGSQPDLELLEQSVQSLPLELRGGGGGGGGGDSHQQPPLHITIESHHAAAAAAAAAGGDPSMGLFPPPPEFSTSTLPHGAFGNIFISVSVGQEPPLPHSASGGANADGTRYPDLIDVVTTRKPTNNKATIAESNVDAAAVAAAYFATLPRRSVQQHHHQQQKQQQQQQQQKQLRLKESDVLVSRSGVPQYDNMGPRITADGSSTISLPETVSMEEIPTPPPPPSCSPMAVNYISL